MRDFTPRRHDAEKGELVVDFAIHGAGPATEWASAARPGSRLGVGGPRGSFVVTDDFDWYLMIGDENGAASHRPPAGGIARRCARHRHRRGCRSGGGAGLRHGDAA